MPSPNSALAHIRPRAGWPLTGVGGCLGLTGFHVFARFYVFTWFHVFTGTHGPIW